MLRLVVGGKHGYAPCGRLAPTKPLLGKSNSIYCLRTLLDLKQGFLSVLNIHTAFYHCSYVPIEYTEARVYALSASYACSSVCIWRQGWTYYVLGQSCE